jgi:hypothetical protein
MNYNTVGSKSGEIQPTPRVHVVQVAIGGVSKTKTPLVTHGLEPNADDIINEYLDTLDLQPWQFKVHANSLYDLYRTYRTSNSNADRSSITALDRLKSFITKLRRAENINKLL